MHNIKLNDENVVTVGGRNDMIELISQYMGFEFAHIVDQFIEKEITLNEKYNNEISRLEEKLEAECITFRAYQEDNWCC